MLSQQPNNANEQPVKKKRIFIGLDYDNCSDLLFNLSSNFSTIRKKTYNTDGVWRETQMGLLNLLKHLAKRSDFQIVVFIISCRQDIQTDEAMAEKNHNGKCFENIERLCHEQGWFLIKFLLADYENLAPAGTAFHDRNLVCKYNNKPNIVRTHLRYLAKVFPARDTESHEVYIVDDDHHHTIFNEVHRDLKKHKNGIQHFMMHYYKFDWRMEIKQKEKERQRLESIQASQRLFKETRTFTPYDIALTTMTAAVAVALVWTWMNKNNSP